MKTGMNSALGIWKYSIDHPYLTKLIDKIWCKFETGKYVKTYKTWKEFFSLRTYSWMEMQRMGKKMKLKI